VKTTAEPHATYMRYWDSGFGTGVKAGAAVAFGLMGMAEAINEKLWRCDHCHRPDDPEACCRGQNFVPADIEGPWICWMCGVDENLTTAPKRSTE
jgi:hypothetical protein